MITPLVDLPRHAEPGDGHRPCSCICHAHTHMPSALTLLCLRCVKERLAITPLTDICYVMLSQAHCSHAGTRTRTGF